VTSISGALLALENNPYLNVICVGRENELRETLERVVKENSRQYEPFKRLRIAHADECVGMDEKPSSVIDRKSTSIYKCVELVVDGKADALVSPGNTGATVASLRRGAITWRHPSSLRDYFVKPGLLARFPASDDEFSYLCDAGALTDVDATTLAHFGLMMRVYLEQVEKKKEPRIALLNIGTEKGKGDSLYKETFELLEKYSEKGLLNFVGNKEPKDVYIHNADGFICSAQIGNTFAKTSEAVLDHVKHMIREKYETEKNPLVKIVSGLSLKLSGIRGHLKEKIDLLDLGGGLLLGSKYNAVIAHGQADERELAGAILYGAKIKDFNLNDEITALLKETHWYSRFRRK
jgi:glycerol-3-phosphate acyltransferase PlsX